MDNKNRLILIGIDGGDWKMINQLQKELPNIDYLVKNGASSVLESTIPPFSPIAWNSLFTGMKPHKHGIFGFVQPQLDSYNYKIVNSSHRKAKALWNYCTLHQIKGIYMYIPFAYPPETVNGIMVSGLGTPSASSKYSYPKWIKKELEVRFTDFKVDYEENKYDPQSEIFLKSSFTILQKQVDAANYLFRNVEDWRIFTIIFRLSDILQHYYFNRSDIIKNAYIYVDNFVGDILHSFREDDNLFIFSDHGFMNASKWFFINNWLESTGYLNLSEKSQNANPFLYGLVNFIRKSPLRKPAIKFLGNKHFSTILKKIPLGGMNMLNRIDERTKAFYVPGGCNSITINLKGRQSNGNVNPHEYDGLIAELKENLLKLRDDSGNSIIEDVFDVKELYGISDLHSTVYDIIFKLRDGYMAESYSNDGLIIKDIENGINGAHHSDGIFMAFGNAIRKGKIGRGCVYNILPTILNMLKIKCPEDMDGIVWRELLIKVNSDPFLANHESSYRESSENSYHPSDEDEMRHRLKELGYL